MKRRICLVVIVFIAALVAAEQQRQGANIPPDVKAVFEKPMYKGAIWGLRVVDLDNGRVLVDLRPQHKFFIASVRKIFSVGELLDRVGPAQRYNTPVYRRGRLTTDGVLKGDLVLVASGDLAMGGRTKSDGSIAITDFDHNEADSLGNSQLTDTNPVAGYIELARQVAKSGVKRVTGNVIVDDRLFKPFNFRGEFNIKPIFINDNVVDLTIHPTTPGSEASVVARPVSAALAVRNTLTTTAPRSEYTLKLNPAFPQCIGQPSCKAEINGQLPIDFVPPLTRKFPVIQTFRIVNPSNYARTVFIEALQAAGVTVDAPPVAKNPVQLLPPKHSYARATKVAELIGLPYSDYAKLILKVSYNIGADTTLLLWGLSRGVDNMQAALRLERANLSSRFGIPNHEFHFIDGSGGGETWATNSAVTQMLVSMTKRTVFPQYLNAMPKLGVDGSLAFVTDFQKDTTLAGATGKVQAKTGTFVGGSEQGLELKGQALGGYLTARSGRRYVFQLVVNNVPITGLNDVLQVFQDQGRIAAILWRDN